MYKKRARVNLVLHNRFVYSKQSVSTATLSMVSVIRVSTSVVSMSSTLDVVLLQLSVQNALMNNKTNTPIKNKFFFISPKFL